MTKRRRRAAKQPRTATEPPIPSSSFMASPIVTPPGPPSLIARTIPTPSWILPDPSSTRWWGWTEQRAPFRRASSMPRCTPFRTQRIPSAGLTTSMWAGSSPRPSIVCTRSTEPRWRLLLTRWAGSSPAGLPTPTTARVNRDPRSWERSSRSVPRTTAPRSPRLPTPASTRHPIPRCPPIGCCG